MFLYFLFPGDVRSGLALRHPAWRIPRTLSHYFRRRGVLLHGENPHRLPVRGGRRRAARPCEGLLCGHCQRLLRAQVPNAGRSRRECSSDHRAGDDLYSVRGRQRESHVQQFPQHAHLPEVLGHHRHRRSAPLRLPQEPESRLQVQLVVHNGAFRHQRPGDRLLPIQGEGLGLGQGQVLHRCQEVPHLHWNYRVQLHLADLPAVPGGEHAETQRVPLHDEMDSHRCLYPQGPVRPGGLPDLGRRNQGGDHRQPATNYPSRGQPLPGGQSFAVLPAALFRRRGGVGENLLPGRGPRLLSGLLRRRWTPKVLGTDSPMYTSGVHLAHGDLCAALRPAHGPHRQPDGCRALLSASQHLPPQALMEKASVAPGVL